ncbi:DNA-processing protein DprA [Amycolatopsis sp. NBC_01480]|uniref:DNA-processing protein DprA n=1 Tax=Amycolatopsis sp. NBC_01480 TaxID=2903562 RepID=UPI002E27EBB2|nr:DNA-processing protein DprA [Amycolatopsis sp. NBC_01480]
MNTPRTLDHAWAYLLRACRPPAPNTVRLAAEVGPIEVIHRHGNGTLPDDVLAEFHDTCGDWEAVAYDVARAAELGARLVRPGHDEWPYPEQAATGVEDATATSAVAPLALWVRGTGRLDTLASGAIAVLGARAATAYGEHNAADLGHELAARGWAIWNGGSLGVAGAAQRGALAQPDARTVAVLGHGLDHTHPVQHENLFERIAENGVLVSEFGFSTPPSKRGTEARDRLIVASTSAVVIVEAVPRTAVISTARLAHKIGRPVMAMPGPVTSGRSNGCHHLIVDGTATLVINAADVEQNIERSSGRTDR